MCKSCLNKAILNILNVKNDSKLYQRVQNENIRYSLHYILEGKWFHVTEFDEKYFFLKFGGCLKIHVDMGNTKRT